MRVPWPCAGVACRARTTTTTEVHAIAADHQAADLPDSQAAAREHRRLFGVDPAFLAHAPGRVNIIGEHVDYHDGLVLPFAIQRRVVVAAAANATGVVRACSAALESDVSVPVDVSGPSRDGGWANYLRGMIAGLRDAGVVLPGATLWIGGDLAPGSGLSSSAALCVATGLALLRLAGREIPRLDLARIAQRAEHDFAGTPCGLMDQYAACFGRSGQALLIDMREMTHQAVPLETDDYRFLVIPSGITHALSAGAYQDRVAAGRRALATIQATHPSVASLRDVTAEMLSRCAAALDPVALRRARHVVSELDRVRSACEALREGRWQSLGDLLWQTQESLRSDYEVSCPPIDEIIAILRDTRGVLGARMVGGGFGGVVLALIEAAEESRVASRVARGYYRKHGIDERPFAVWPADGAASVTLGP